jgi:hypothetical protein
VERKQAVKRNLSLGSTIGTQGALLSILGAIVAIDGLEPWHQMLGFLVVGVLIVVVSVWAKRSDRLHGAGLVVN